MTQTMTKPEQISMQLQEVRSEGPAWLATVRRAAMERFNELGFPSSRDEAWRTTNVAPIASTEWSMGAEPAVDPSERDLAPYTLADETAARLVFVNGFLRPALSRAGDLPAGVRVADLRTMLSEQPDRLRGLLAEHARFQDDAFVAMNTALMSDGAVVLVEDGCKLEAPIEVLFVTQPDGQAQMTCPRTLIVAGDGADVTVIERFVGLADGAYLTNAVTEIVAGSGTRVDHYKMGRESTEAFHIGTLQIDQGGDSDVASKVITLGGRLVRNGMNTVLGGSGGDCNLRGLTVAGEGQLIDNHLRVEHAVAHCDSREFFKNILDGDGRVVFTGRIFVAPDAQKTDAKQTNMSLLLSDDAQVNAQPQLEIYADDVKCTHGATVGELSEEAMFYLRSRGLDEATARSLLIYAFAAESLDEVRVDALRRQIERILFDRLPGGRLLAER